MSDRVPLRGDPADDRDPDVAQGRQLAGHLRQELVVEAAAETLLREEDDEFGRGRMLDGDRGLLFIAGPGHGFHQPGKGLVVFTGTRRALADAADLRVRHQFHRPGDLAETLDGPDAAFNCE